MNKHCIIGLCCILFASFSALRGQDVSEYNVPETAKDCMERHHVLDTYELSGRINPFYLRGDFNGDGRLDYAVLVIQKSTGKRGIYMCVGTAAYILGAGKSFHRSDGYDFTDFNFEAWTLYPRRTVIRSPEEGPAPRLRGEAILVQWPEAGSGIIYWDGKAFVYYALGG